MDYLTLGSSPVGEPCAQMGSPDYYEKVRIETKAYLSQLVRHFGHPEEHNCRFKVKSFPHDFGNYYEVCVIFNENDEDSTEFAFKCESELPEYWDEIAQVHLLPKFPSSI